MLKASLEYVLTIQSQIITKTSKGPKRLAMVYDPGAGTTTISRQLALDSGYSIQKSTDYVDGVGGRVQAGYTIIPDLILGGVSLGPVYAHVVDFHEELAQKTSALLGMNVLSWFKITQDCHWNTTQNRFDSATLLFEPKFDVNDKIELEQFAPLERGQRFGTVFHVDRTHYGA